MNDSQLKKIRLRDGVFAPRQKINREVTIPTCIRRCEETGRFKAFKLQWKPGDPDQPHVFWDSDVAKVLEGMAAALMLEPDPAMEKQLDELVELVIGAQQPDGYLNTHFTQVEPENRWKDLARQHELYDAGHLMEAAVAYFQATGKRNFLDAMCRYADYIASVFGREPGKKRGYPGHEEIELALVKLARISGNKHYLELADYFVRERGREPNYYVEQEHLPRERLKNIQAHKPLLEQTEADGHAVRAMYLFSGATDVARETGAGDLLQAVERLFRNVVEKRMYVTGGIGSARVGECFTVDYGLPNDTAYTESCAAIGLALLSKRLLDATGKAEYADVLEQVLYNNGLSGISLAGDTFFYCNPLEAGDTSYDPVKTARQKWFDCSCCPTNYCRFLPRLGLFCADATPEKLQIDIPAAMDISLPEYEVEVRTQYPYDGCVSVRIIRDGEFTLALRIPGWCRNYRIAINGDPFDAAPVNGYWIYRRIWQSGDEIRFTMEMNPEVIYANPNVPSDAGKAAIRRGPVVYCLESVDNPDILLHTVRIPAHPEFQVEPAAGLPEGTLSLLFRGEAVRAVSGGPLYSAAAPQYVPVTLRAIPYMLWQNRGPASMQTFLLVR